MALSWKSRRRLALAVLLVGLPAYIVLAVTLMNRLDRAWGRAPFWVELAVYVGLGVLWALPLRRVFAGIGRPDPEAQGGSGAAGDQPAGRPPDRPA
ncbi:MAG: DUF2842 domain-containing protein [Rhodobacteraceae bacterium]|nr:DUF2842 domain-containing protein [Paracoccaceae bacterium]